MAPPALPRLKRPKVAIACDICRRRKIKCDGIRPECAPCRARGDPRLRCTWDDSHSRVDIQRLQRQVEELQQTRLSPGTTATSSSDAYVQGRSPSWGPSPPPRRLPTETDRDSPASAMIGPVDISTTGGTYGFFGDSSAGKFVAQIREAVQQQQHTQSHLPSPTPLNLNLTHPSGPRPHLRRNRGGQWRKISLDECALPPRSRADALMSVYWDAVHPLYPFVDRVVIAQQYESLFGIQTEAGEISSFLLCALNLIFALACQLDTTIGAVQRRHHSAQVFFERAQKSLDLWQLPSSLESVQVLLLLAQYLQSTNEPLQCWNFVGSAVRMAENLGLHLPESSENAACIRDREMMRRVWHGCVLMDRVSAMAYGRPTMINRAVAARTPLPIAVDEEELVESCQGETGRPSRLDFFVQSLKLYDVLEEILRTFYANKDRERRDSTLIQPGVASVIDIDSKMMAWETDLPEQLRYNPAGQEPSSNSPISSFSTPVSTFFLRQAVVLRQRFLHVRLLCLRPILYRLISSKDSTSSSSTTTNNTNFLAPRMTHHCAMICIKVAQETIALAHAHRSSTWATTGLLSAWWYNILFVYSAATVLLAARLRPSLPDPEISSESILESWSRAMSLLEGYKDYSESIPALITTLNLLFDQVQDRCGPLGMGVVTPTTTAEIMQSILAETALGGGGEDVIGGELSNTTPGMDWETFLDPTNFSWLDCLALEA